MGEKKKKKKGCIFEVPGETYFFVGGGGQEKTKEYLWSIKSGM